MLLKSFVLTKAPGKVLLVRYPKKALHRVDTQERPSTRYPSLRQVLTYQSTFHSLKLKDNVYSRAVMKVRVEEGVGLGRVQAR